MTIQNVQDIRNSKGKCHISFEYMGEAFVLDIERQEVQNFFVQQGGSLFTTLPDVDSFLWDHQDNLMEMTQGAFETYDMDAVGALLYSLYNHGHTTVFDQNAEFAVEDMSNLVAPVTISQQEMQEKLDLISKVKSLF